MKIIFLNVWGDQMRDTLPAYLKEQARDTDIFCLQEATLGMKQACADILKDYYELSDFKYISEKDNFPQSLFIKKSLNIVSSGTLFQGDMNVGLAVYVELQLGETSFIVCNVHGRAQPSEKLDTPDRIRFSQGIIDFFKDKNVPIVIGGDFNLEHDTESVKVFELNGYRNLINEYAVRTTRNHYAWDRYPGHELYYSDYVFVNGLVPLDTFVVEANEVSDHLPLMVGL